MTSTKDINTPPMIYVAGPYTKPDPVENTHHMIRIGDALWGHGVVPIVPHLSLLWQCVRPRGYDEWLEYDLHIMARCDAVLRVPGESLGADREVRMAIKHRQPVIRPSTPDIAESVSVVQQWLQHRGDN